ncbi:tripartite motif-containing protein 60-like [Trichechus manatus latirostris]|uniref:Tripartite motif-containing protein 60-like n=1 Tax=Trichechus manatus latirostris TaxID=127582 RepID=A0A2Y9QPV3_TRIMA|nr:tripartite motif-containing protein 60-like [Trichechus manatus latirostris]
MAFAAYLADLHTEASCPICLDYLRDPITTDCGHNFCRSCIQQCWVDLQDIFPCPVCLQQCSNGSLKRNTQLCNMTDIVKQLPITRSKRKLQEEKPLCEKHNQTMALFCAKDLELLCPQCRISSNHQDHHLMSIEEAATSHRRKLKKYIEPLRKHVGDAENGLEMAVSKLVELKCKVENQNSELHSEFQQFVHFLAKEREAIHVRLLNEEEDVLKKLIENKIQISDHTSTLKNLLSEITEKCVQADLDLLTGIGSIRNRYELLKNPTVFSYELEREHCCLPPQYFGLQNMINTFQVNLILDPETAHPDLIISEDRKTVIYKMMNPNCPQSAREFNVYPSALSSEGFDSGRHFGQVEVRGRGEWSLGVCKESFPRNVITSPSPNNGCWQIELWTSEFATWESVNLSRIGVFMDCELGEVSFYNLNNRSLLYTSTVTSVEKLIPYFSIGPSSNSLAISIVRNE